MKKCIFLLLGLFLLSPNQIIAKKRKNTNPSNRLVIGGLGKKAGLFACFFQALNNLSWCERNNVEPVIYWGEDSLYYQEGGYNGATNVWEYYFEPLSLAGYQQGEPIWRYYSDPSKGKLIPEVYNKRYELVLEKEFRYQVNNLIKRYITIKPSIIDRVELFYKEKMAGRQTIGIHLRGTDHRTEVVPVSVERICAVANELAQVYPSDCQFFIATDEESLLKKAIELLNGPVIFYDSFRSVNGKSIHRSRHSYSKAKAGEEVLMEVLTFARCDKFVHIRTNVATAALFFNPELDNKILYSGLTIGTTR